ncbi:MAG: hypothetical protein WKF84_26010 [Pyrinomonadaceae bacterium]
MPPYLDHHKAGICPTATRLAARGLSLPSSATLSEDDIIRIVSVIQNEFTKTVSRTKTESWLTMNHLTILPA